MNALKSLNFSYEKRGKKEDFPNTHTHTHKVLNTCQINARGECQAERRREIIRQVYGESGGNCGTPESNI